MTKFPLMILCAFSLCLLTSFVSAQEMQFSYLYHFEPVAITEAPELGGLDVDFPEAARKNGVEGTLKLSCTLGADGRTHDITLLNDLGQGTGAALVASVTAMRFKPAKLDGRPVDVKVTIDYAITLVYDALDKNVSKPKILEKPLPPYPQNRIAEGAKGKVTVRVLFMASGEVRVLGTTSVMERDFDKAAADAAAKIKFTPATHKKSRKPVSQQMDVIYDFKP